MAMANGPFEDVFPVQNDDFTFRIFVYPRVSGSYVMLCVYLVIRSPSVRSIWKTNISSKGLVSAV